MNRIFPQIAIPIPRPDTPAIQLSLLTRGAAEAAAALPNQLRLHRMPAREILAQGVGEHFVDPGRDGGVHELDGAADA